MSHQKTICTLCQAEPVYANGRCEACDKSVHRIQDSDDKAALIRKALVQLRRVLAATKGNAAVEDIPLPE